MSPVIKVVPYVFMFMQSPSLIQCKSVPCLSIFYGMIDEDAGM